PSSVGLRRPRRSAAARRRRPTENAALFARLGFNVVLSGTPAPSPERGGEAPPPHRETPRRSRASASTSSSVGLRRPRRSAPARRRRPTENGRTLLVRDLRHP